MNRRHIATGRLIAAASATIFALALAAAADDKAPAKAALDIGDAAPPFTLLAPNGKAVSLADLKCQLLREPDDIARSAGHLKGKAEVLDCPACGASISWRPAVAAHLHCPACGTESDATTGTAEIMDAARREALVHTTLALGDVAKIDGEAFSLIGLMQIGRAHV